MAFLPFILRRATRHWQILLTLGLGVILSTALLTSSPLLVDTVVEFGLRHTLQNSEPADSHLRLSTRIETDQARYQALDAQVQARLQERLGAHLNQTIRLVDSPKMFPWVEGQLVADQRIGLSTYEGIAEHVEFIEGGWPGAAPGGPNVVPAVIPEEMALTYVLRVGDRLPLSFKPESEAVEAWIEVTGIARPQHPRDPYWFGDLSPMLSQSTQRWALQYNAIVPADTFFSTTASLFPESSVSAVWHVLLAPEKIKTGAIAPLRGQLAALQADLRTFDSRVTLQTGLDDLLGSYDAQAEAIRVPLYILTAEVVLLALYYVTMVAALSVQEAEREFAVLRSRGASGWQVLKIQLTEAGLISAVAFLSGPVVGYALVQGLVWAGPLADVGQSNWTLSFSQNAWLAAGVGAVACFLGLMLPLGPALRRSIVAHQQSVTRETRPPWWQRFYLDVFVLLVGLILLWRQQYVYGGLMAGGTRPRLDWLLLLSPLALLLGTATILLRVFPLVLRGLAAITTRARGLAGALAMWQASRNPSHVARLVLLLTLAIALGILSTGLNATLDQSEFERAHYVSGNDVRLVSRRAIPLRDLEATTGVLDLASTWRGTGSVDLRSRRSYPQFDLLAIEPHSFAGMTMYRDDFADAPMGMLLGLVTSGERQQSPLLPIPGRPARLQAWMLTQPDDTPGRPHQDLVGYNDLERIGLQAKLQTAQGDMFTVQLQPVESDPATLVENPPVEQLILRLNVGGRETGLTLHITPDLEGWRRFETALPVLPPSSYPLSLHSLWIQNRARQQYGGAVGTSMQLTLDELAVVDADTGAASSIEGFEDPTRIWFLDDTRSTARFTRSGNAYAGQATLALDLRFGQAFQTVGLKLTQGFRREPLPALVSPAFLESTELQVGDRVRTWVNSIAIEFEIVGAVNYFPTMYEDKPAGYLITSRSGLVTLLNEIDQSATNANEVFLSTGEGVSVETLEDMVPNVAQIWQAESTRKTLKADPLALGLRSVTLFGYGLTALLSLVGFATHFYTSARRRATVYGVMRAMGLSPRQLYGSLVLEQVVLILAGLALGTVLGVLLNQLTLPRLPVTLGDQLPIPPFRPHSDWLAVGRIYVGLALAFLVSLGVATALLWRARVHRILRIGQE
jgi:hypothetical protein